MAADRLTAADATLRALRFGAEANAARDAAYAAASDASAKMYAEAEERHADRLAAIQRHFGQQITSRRTPDVRRRA